MTLSNARRIFVGARVYKLRVGSLYSPSCREGEFPETHMHLYESLFVKTGAKGHYAP